MNNYTAASGGYTASSIKVLTTEQAEETFEWLRAENLASTYTRPLAYIKRALEACTRAGVSHTYFVDRYLKGDKSIPKHDGADAAMREILGL